MALRVPGDPREDRLALGPDQAAELVLNQRGDGGIVVFKLFGLHDAAQENSQQHGSGRGPIRELHAQERNREDRSPFGRRNHRAEAVQGMTDLVAAVGDVGDQGRGIGNRPKLQGQGRVLGVQKPRGGVGFGRDDDRVGFARRAIQATQPARAKPARCG